MQSKKLPTTTKSRPSKPVAGPRKRAQSAAAVPAVADFMTRSPHTIGRDQTLVQARELMNKYRIRHLPVLDGGRLVGILSQRDLYFVESLDGSSSSDRVSVEEAMSQDVFETTGETPLSQVTQAMVRRKLGSAVVMRDGRIAGVFSTIDAMKALLRFLPGQP